MCEKIILILLTWLTQLGGYSQHSALVIYQSGLQVTKNDFPAIVISDYLLTINELNTKFNLKSGAEITTIQSVSSNAKDLQEIEVLIRQVTDTMKLYPYMGYYGSLEVLRIRDEGVVERIGLNQKEQTIVFLHELAKLIDASQLIQHVKIKASLDELRNEIEHPVERDRISECYRIAYTISSGTIQGKQITNDQVPESVLIRRDSLLSVHFSPYQIENYLSGTEVRHTDSTYWFTYAFGPGPNTDVFCLPVFNDFKKDSCIVLPEFLKYDKTPLIKGEKLEDFVPDASIEELDFLLFDVSGVPVWHVSVIRKSGKKESIKLNAFTGEDITTKIIYDHD